MHNSINISNDATTLYYDDSDIVEATSFVIQSINGDNLEDNTVKIVLDLNVVNGEIQKNPEIFKYGDKIVVSHDMKVLGTYYVSKVTKIGKTKFSIDGVSIIGLLGNITDYGGIYIEDSLVKDILDEMLQDYIPYKLAPELASTFVRGWLPVASCRSNLHQILFAINAGAFIDNTGTLNIAPLYATAKKQIPENNVYMNGSVQYPDKVDAITIIEHNFTSQGNQDPESVLYEGTIPTEPVITPAGFHFAEGLMLVFDEPYHYYSVIGDATPIARGPNYIVVIPHEGLSGVKVTIKGRKYIHSTRNLVKRLDPATIADLTKRDRIVTIDKAYLVSSLNSDSVSKRLLSYYSSAKTISTDILVTDEKPGDSVILNNPFQKESSGIIRSMSFSIGNSLKATTEIIADYQPPKPSGSYNTVQEFTNNTTWTVPQSVEEIRYVLISGGTGGASGTAGENGPTPDDERPNEQGIHGSAGMAGSGGKVLIGTLTVTPGQSLTVGVGVGGKGGRKSKSTTKSNLGSEGTPSTLDSFTSATGKTLLKGYHDILDYKKKYAVEGKPGVDGRSGADPSYSGSSIYYDGVNYNMGKKGPDAEDNNGIGEGGYGGGPAVGQNGGDGSNGAAWDDRYDPQLNGGPGGSGGNAVIKGKTATIPGNGGDGGHGGGGGGAGGRCISHDSSNLLYPGNGGKGGYGGEGGDGAPGIVLIYYFDPNKVTP